MLKSVTLICTYVLCCSALFAQQINIIPQPLSVITKKDKFTITSATKLVVKDKKDYATASFLSKYLEEYYGIKLKQVSTDADKSITISSGNQEDGLTASAYKIQSGTNGIQISGSSAVGSFYGMQTLIQLLPLEKSKSLIIPAVDIEDEPRFAYRGAMLDVCRHFFSVSFIKKYIDYLALHKINYFLIRTKFFRN